MDDPERDLATTVDELAETLESLRAELREPPRGPLGIPRPPTPGEFLRFTERYAIPATISLLEASIRTLELLAAAIRVADGRPLDGESTVRREAAAGTDRITAASRRTLGALDDALAELQSAAAGGEVGNPELQRLLSEARELRDEVDDRLAESTAGGSPSAGDAEPVDIEVEMGEDESRAADDEGGPADAGVDVDVDRELESIKREFDESADEAPGEESGGSADDSGVRHDDPADDRGTDVSTGADAETDRGEESDEDAGDDGPETGDDAE